MFQYLLNTTAIWLLCLLAYDLFLGMEASHRYNRLYLLGSLLLGILLPMVEWQTELVVYHSPDLISVPINNITTAKQEIETAILPESPPVTTIDYLWLFYMIGVAFHLVIMVREALLLLNLYVKGHRYKEGKWTVVETHRNIGPFSFFNCIFLGNREMYNDGEWSILLRHEGEHIACRHYIDVIAIQLVKIIFWFHPLVYLFRKRILLVHEYQADATGADHPSEYGTFLIEQALLQTSYSITHSFNRSPIKKRILMLTKKSSKRNLLKAFVAVPVTLCCVLCFSQYSYSYKKTGDDENVIVFKGNRIEFSGPVGKGKDATVTTSDKGGKQEAPTVITFYPAPVKINGKPIRSTGEVTKEPVFLGGDHSLSKYIFANTKALLDRLEDGTYFIHIAYPIVDEKGNLAYYENQGLMAAGKQSVDEQIQKSFKTKIDELLDDAPKFKPAELKGTTVAWYDAWAVELGYRVVVANHVAKLEYSKPH